MDLAMEKLNLGPNYPGKFVAGRQWPGDPGPEAILSGLRNKAPKLSVAAADKRILLLEKDAVAGTMLRSDRSNYPGVDERAESLSRCQGQRR